MAVCKDCYTVHLLTAVIVGPFQMRLNGVTNCGELKVRHLSYKKAPIRSHGHGVHLGISPMKMSFLNILAHFSETNQMAEKVADTSGSVSAWLTWLKLRDRA